MEDLLTDLMVHYMTDPLNWNLYVGQDLHGLLSKKQSTWGQGEIHRPCKDFLRNAHSKFRPRRDVLLKCRFLIEYIQPSLHENVIPVLSNRYWSTEPCQTRYFNNYIFYSLRGTF